MVREPHTRNIAPGAINIMGSSSACPSEKRRASKFTEPPINLILVNWASGIPNSRKLGDKTASGRRGGCIGSQLLTPHGSGV